MGNAATTLSLGVALEEFANLEEQHDEDGFGELCLGTWQETYGKGADGGYRHQEMFVEGIAVHQSFDGFLQRFVTYQQVRNEIDQQQLPRRQCPLMFDDDSDSQQQGGNDDERQLTAQRVLLMMVFMLMMMFMLVMMFMLMMMFMLVMVLV